MDTTQMHDVIDRTIVDVFRLANGKTAITLDDQTTIVCTFPSHVNENPMKSYYGRSPRTTHKKSAITRKADAMRQADEVAHLGGREPRRKVIIDDVDFGSPEFMPDYTGVGRTHDETAKHALNVAQSTNDIPDIR